MKKLDEGADDELKDALKSTRDELRGDEAHLRRRGASASRVGRALGAWVTDAENHNQLYGR